MSPKKQSPSVQQTAIGDGNVQIVGDQNVVNQTIIRKFFNIFKSDAETLEQRNRRIMLGHVENFWVKGILEKSLHGAALLELGIKEDPNALNYPWAIKRESTKETLPAGTSILQIFQEIGMGRSLLILGAPGSGKTTMLLELTRQLIERAREDVTEPIPVVFNLSSWTEKYSLADWLAHELNVIYSIPKKVAPIWVKENKMLLLLDGLDELEQESRDKCVDAINQFRKENGLTSIAVCSRVQDYVELQHRLSLDGAIEIQSLTSNQVDEYFKQLGEGTAGIRQVLEKDIALREMAQTPLLLSIMTLALRDTRSKEFLFSRKLDTTREYLFETYIARMFERPERSRNERFRKLDVLRWLSRLAHWITQYNQVPFLIENMQIKWLGSKKQWPYKLIYGLLVGLIYGLFVGIIFDAILGVVVGMISGVIALLSLRRGEIEMVDTITWDWKQGGRALTLGLFVGLISGWAIGILIDPLLHIDYWQNATRNATQSSMQGSTLASRLSSGLLLGLLLGPLLGQIGVLTKGLSAKPVSQTRYPEQRLILSIKNSFMAILFFALLFGLLLMLLSVPFRIQGDQLLSIGLFGGRLGMVVGLIGWSKFGGGAVLQHYTLRILIAISHILPFHLIPLFNYCTHLIFLHRVGGGYIFVHRLLMEHFADMYPADEK